MCCSSPKEWLRSGWKGIAASCDAGGVCGDCTSLIDPGRGAAGEFVPERLDPSTPVAVTAPAEAGDGFLADAPTRDRARLTRDLAGA
ncbi:hypothetical protein ABTX35_34760, partial [Streptomyces sp. NPDC096080]|uniref:hypothetical protein n=1 Tax=Streptomyces sp. NPDC096080 TaxID=3156693 RepID=UPI00332E6B78